MKYAISVIDRIAEIRNINLATVLDEEYTTKLHKESNFLGFGSAAEWLQDTKITSNYTKNIHEGKIPKFLNWYSNERFIKMWDSKDEAEKFLEELIDYANKHYKTKKDPFLYIINTKGDWKNFMFVVSDITNYDRN